jgi:hypothetical protein
LSVRAEREISRTVRQASHERSRSLAFPSATLRAVCDASSRTRPAATALALALGACACFTPPAVVEVRGLERSALLDDYPAGTELVQIDTPHGSLHGFFVPAGANAPIVVHLLGSGASVVSPFGTPVAAAFALSGLGLASLLVDYAGVGASSGERSVDHLALDARAAWEAALARAGGDAGRVHVRATSIGTLATAELLAAGVRPGSIVLIAPVMPGSALPRGAAALYGDPLGVVAELLFRPITRVSLLDVLPAGPSPTLVFEPKSEEFAWDREISAMRVATEQGGGTWRVLEGDHIGIALLANDLLPGETAWWIARADVARRAAGRAALLERLDPADRAHFGPGSAAEQRLDALAGFARLRPAKDVAAAALAIRDPRLAILTLRLESGQHAGLDFAQVVECFSPTAPIRPIDADEIAVYSVLFRDLRRGGRLDRDPALWWKYGEASAHGGRLAFAYSIPGPDDTSYDLRATISPPAVPASDDDVAREDDVRRAVQALLRGAGVPHRARRDPDGGWRLEVLVDGGWVEIGPPPR